MPRKVIIDTDIGFDLDDTWAILFAIKCKEFDVKLISISDGDLEYKTKLTAKLLQLCNRVDIPIAIGKSLYDTVCPQKDYVEGFDLNKYPGKIYQNYRDAYQEVLEKDNCDIVELSPMSSIQDVSDIIEKYHCKIYAMMGSINYGHRGQKGTIPEYNVEACINGAQKIFKNSNEFTMLPLDACGTFIMNKDIYNELMRKNTPVVNAIKVNYELWLNNFPHAKEEFSIDNTSSILFDLSTFAYMLYPDCFKAEEMNITIDDKGYTKVDDVSGKRINVVTETIKLDEIMNKVAKVLSS